jgi:hypothetical protein
MEKIQIRKALVLAIIRCSQTHELIKLYREVLTIVTRYDYKTWLPVQEIVANLQMGENLAPIFHCIIAVCENYTNS